MHKILPLSQEIISKIAAGEVIERPVYAVKELVENAIDAKADTISVRISDSGLKNITVIDNGQGMSKEDLLECFKPHTTSKLSSVDQLDSIATMGFRGEALSSIAAISKMTLKSKTKNAKSGFSLEIREGALETISPVGMPVGTQVTVENLFYPVPGRKKFLKSSRTEFRHIVDLLTHFALSHPSIHFSLTHNGKMIFDLPSSPSSWLAQDRFGGISKENERDSGLGQNDEILLERVKTLLGSDIFANLLPVSFEDSYIKVSGFLTKPASASASVQKQFLFVNGRKITDKLVSLALKEAYGTLIEHTHYPVGILFLTLPYEVVDVNVHPRKEEVRFVDNELLYEAIYRCTAETLAKNNLTFHTDTWKGIGLSDSSDTKSYAGRLLREKKLPWTIEPIIEVSGNEIMQIHNVYLITPVKNGLLVTDQHAAHERILYEQLLDEFEKQKYEQPVYEFPKEKFFDVSIADTEVLNEHLSLFTKMGFGIEHFKKNTFLLHCVPMLFQDRNYEELIAEIIADLRTEKKVKAVDSASRKMIAYLACRAAVKAGDKLTKKQAKDLLDLLKKTPNNTTCPHGRPVQVVVPITNINKLFKRK